MNVYKKSYIFQAPVLFLKFKKYIYIFLIIKIIFLIKQG